MTAQGRSAGPSAASRRAYVRSVPNYGQTPCRANTSASKQDTKGVTMSRLESRTRSRYRAPALCAMVLLATLVTGASPAVAGNWAPTGARVAAIAPLFELITTKGAATYKVACAASLTGKIAAANLWLGTLRLDPPTCQRQEGAGWVATHTRVIRNPLEAVSLTANSARLVLSGTTEIEIEQRAGCIIFITSQGLTGGYLTRTNGISNPSLWYLNGVNIAIKQPANECAANGGMNTTGRSGTIIFAMINQQNRAISTS